MSQTITVKNIASFGNEGVSVRTDKFNIIYGLNGTGKTTISEFLRNKDANDYEGCSFNEEQGNIFVYNRGYIADVFREGEIDGIYTLGKKNNKIEEEINLIESQKERLKIILQRRSDGEVKKEQKLSQLKEQMLDFMKPLKGSIMKRGDYLEGLQKADKLIEILKKTKLEEGQGYNQFDLERRAEKLAGDLEKISNKPEKLSNSIAGFSELPIWKEEITSSNNGYLDGIIKKLENENWIREGVATHDEYIESEKKCPFCDSDINDERINNLRNLIDDEYSEKVKQINAELEELKLFEKKVVDVELVLAKLNDIEVPKTISENIITLRKAIETNIVRAREKSSQPARIDLVFEDTSELINNINQDLKIINSRIDNHNRIVDNKKQERDNLKKDVRSYIRFETNDILQEYNETVIALQNLKECTEKLEGIRDDKGTKISDLRKELGGIEGSVNSINNELKAMGIDSFFLKTYPSDGEKPSKFKINRPNKKASHSDERVYDTLSEGEKTLIAFLYFLHRCEGGKEQGKDIDRSERIIVIDDPICSLSHNFIFEIACLIKDKFIKKDTEYKQIILLTHHLYFMHEILLKSYNENKWKLYRLFKNENNTSVIQSMERSDIKNEYESYCFIM